MRALGDAARGGHTWVSTADPEGQRALERAGLSGAPGRVHPERTIHVSVQNGTATKLDWFVDPTVDVDVAVNADDSAIVTHDRDDAEHGARTDARRASNSVPTDSSPTIAGLYRGRVYFWGPAGGDQLDSVAESGLRLSFTVAEVPGGRYRASVTFTTVVPKAVRHGKLALRFVPQPRVRPMHAARARDRRRAGRVQRSDAYGATWDRTFDLVVDVCGAADNRHRLFPLIASRG